MTMDDNDKRNSSVPDAASGDSKPDMFDQHEATLPRFTIDPGDAPQRQRTRTLLGVPSLVAEEPARLPVPPTPGGAPSETTQASGTLSSASVDADTFPAVQASRQDEPRSTFDVTIDVVDDELNDVTMVSDADVVALPDNTGQLQPVRFDEPVAAAAATASTREVTATQTAAYASTAPNPSSLAPREIARTAGGSAPENEPASGRFGALLVAAVMLLATGAWFLTAGSFRRATLSSAESTTAAATQPAANAAAEKIETGKDAPAEAPKAAEAAAPATPVAPAPSTSAQAPASDDSAAPGTGLKNKPALTAAARGERVRRNSRAKAAAPAPTGELPQGPTRTEVVTRLESVRPAVNACAAGRSGVADLDVTIAHTGVVMHVLVGGDFAGTTEGSCIARAVRGARFPAFKQERFRLLYPYAI